MINRLSVFLQDRALSLNKYLWAYIIAFITTIIWIFSININNWDNSLLEILTTCGIIFPLMVTWSLIIEIQKNKKSYQVILSQILPLILWSLFYIYINSIDIFNDTISVDKDWIFVISSYIIARISILWWIVLSTYKETNITRWRLKEIIINMLIAIISSLILWWWVSASVWSIDYLFDVNIYYKRYQYIGIVSFCLIGVSIFLTNLSVIRKPIEYPSIFRFFWLYIFLPLAIIYSCILTTYWVKIIVSQIWPKWLISWMVLWYTIRSTIVYFLTYPLKTKSWISKIHTWYFISILVFLPLILWAIRQRISQYWITELRYLIIMIALWIGIVGIWSLIERKKSWIFIIWWFLLLIINSTYTPRSASNISLNSQKNRLEKLLINNWLYKDYIVPQTINIEKISPEKYNMMEEIWQIANYISQYHWNKELKYLYTWEWFNAIKDNTRWNIYQPFLESLWYTGVFNEWGHWNIESDDMFINIYFNKNNSNLKKIDINKETSLLIINSEQNSTNQIWEYNITLEGIEKEEITITKPNKEKIYINLYNYKDTLYNFFQSNNEITPIINFDEGIIIIDSLNWNINKKDKNISIGYYSIMVFINN